MFTGIIEEIGCIKNIVQKNNALELVISANKIMNDINLGDSIAVNGVCLTVTKYDTKSFHVDVMPETYHATNLNKLKALDSVNLERALAVGGRLGGHFVTGHVDGIGEIIEVKPISNAITYKIKCNEDILRYCIYKGSIAIDGTSLTIFALDKSSLSISLIPHTVSHTILGDKKVGSSVNLECDMLGKYVIKMTDKQDHNKIDYDFLVKNGF